MISWIDWSQCSATTSTFWGRSQSCSSRITSRTRHLSYRSGSLFPFSWQLIELPASQRCAVPLFTAYKPPLTQNITANIKGLVNSVALAVELAPSAAWGEPLHVSGLFSVLVDQLSADNVNHYVLPSEVGNWGLPGLTVTGPHPH